MQPDEEMTDAQPEPQTLTVQTSDGVTFDVPMNIAMMSTMIRRHQNNGSIVLSDVDSKMFQIILDLCKDPDSENKIFGPMSPETREHLLAVVNHLDIDSLIERVKDIQTVNVVTNDGVTFHVPKNIAKMSVTVNNMLEDISDDDDSPIPLPNIRPEIYKIILDYCTYRYINPVTYARDKDVPDWEKEHFDTLPHQKQFEIINSANYLNISPLIEITCRIVAEFMKRSSEEEIMRVFNIKKKLTEEEKNAILEEHGWAMKL